MPLDKDAIFHRIGYQPHPGQAPVHASRALRRVLACGVRFGKTTAAAAEAIAAALEPSKRDKPRRGWIAAPTYDLCDKAFREIVLTMHERLPFLVKVSREHERLLVVQNLGGGFTEIRGKTAENPVSLLGEGLDFLIVDEAARLKPDIWDRYLSARLVDKQGWALLISTPRGKGWYYDAWRRGQNGRDPMWESWNAPTSTNPHVDARQIEAQRTRIPEGVFRQEYLAEFMEGGGQVFRNVRDVAQIAAPEPYDPEETYYAGLDLAKTKDYTVLVILDSKLRLVAWDRFHRINWTQQVARVSVKLKDYGEPLCVVDSTGKGEPVYEALREAGVRCIGYPFTSASKAALVNNLAILMERRSITLPTESAWPEMVDEMEAFQYSVTDAGNVSTGAPSGYHDDCVCALMLAAWEARDGGDYEVYEV